MFHDLNLLNFKYVFLNPRYNLLIVSKAWYFFNFADKQKLNQ